MESFFYNKRLFPFDGKQINIEGNNIFYIDEGKGDILLFCHPPIGSSFMYRNLIRKLSSSYRCIALDFPGFGLSTTRPGYDFSIQSQSGIVEKFISKLGLVNIIPVMQEVGGHAALTALLRTPEKVKGIIITDTIIFPVSEYPKVSKMLELVNGNIFNFLNTRFNFLIRAFCRFGIRRRKLSRDERSAYKAIFNTREKRRLITAMLYQLKTEEELMHSIKSAFETIFRHIPILLIYGDQDPVYKLGIPQRIRSMVGSAELELIKGEAHFPHEGTPDEMTEIIQNWMRRKYKC